MCRCIDRLAVRGVACVLVAFVCFAPTHAALIWDIDAVTAGRQGGAGVWSTAATNWFDGTNNVGWADGQDAVFNASPNGAVSISATINVNSITFDVGSYVITGAGLNLGAGGLVANADATILAPIGGTAGLVKSGTGAVLLRGATNTFSGQVQIDAGKLIIADNAALGSASNTVRLGGATSPTAGGTLTLADHTRLNRTVNVGGSGGTIEVANRKIAIFSGQLANTAATDTFTKTGLGELNIVSGQSYTGKIILGAQAGTLRLTGSGTLNSGGTPAAIDILSGSTLAINNRDRLSEFANPANLTDRVADTTPVTLKGGSITYQAGNVAGGIRETLGTSSVAVTLAEGYNGLYAASGGTTGNGGELYVNNITRNIGATVNVTASGTLGTAGDNGRVYAASVNGAALTANVPIGWAVNGTGDGVVYTANGFAKATYGTTFAGGAYTSITTNTTIGTTGSPATITTGGFRFGADVDLALTFANVTDVLNVESGVVLSSDNNRARSIGSSGTPGRLTAGGTSGAGPVELFVYQNQNTMTIAAAIIDNDTRPLTLVKSQNGTLTLSNSNSYTGGTFVNGGTLNTGNATTPLGTGKVYVNNGYLNLQTAAATSYVSTGLSDPTYKAVGAGQINVPYVALPGEYYYIGAGAVIGCGQDGKNADVGLNALTRGTNITLERGAVVAHNWDTANYVYTTDGSEFIKNLGTNADLFMGLADNIQDAGMKVTVGTGTPWMGLSTDRNGDRMWQQGTIEANSDFTIWGMSYNQNSYRVMNLGNNVVPGEVIKIVPSAINPSSTVRVSILGDVALRDENAEYEGVTFVVTPGANLRLRTSTAMGIAGKMAAIDVQPGGTIHFDNTANSASGANGNIEFVAGTRLLTSSASGLTGTGTLTFRKDSVIEITHTNGITGSQITPANVDPGTILRLGATAPTGLGSNVPASVILEISGGDRGFTDAAGSLFTLSAVGGVGGMIVNDGVNHALSISNNGYLSIGSGGATFAATTGTTLTIRENFALGANNLTIGSPLIVDGYERLGQVTFDVSGSTATKGATPATTGSITVVNGAKLYNDEPHTMPDLGRLIVNAGGAFDQRIQYNVETIGSVEGNGLIGSSETTNTPTVQVGYNNFDTTFAGSFTGSLGGQVKVNKIGTGALTLTGQNTSTGNLNIHQGELKITGPTGQTAFGTAYVNTGGTLTLDNSADYLTNRLGGKIVYIAGGTFNFVGKNGTAVSETLSVLRADSGVGKLVITPGTGAGASTTLALTTLDATASDRGAMRVDVAGGGTLGAAAPGVATITAATANLRGGTGAAGTATRGVRPDIVAKGNDGFYTFTTYDATAGLVPLDVANNEFGTAFGSSVNVLLDASPAAFTANQNAGTVTFRGTGSSPAITISDAPGSLRRQLTLGSAGTIVRAGTMATYNVGYISQSLPHLVWADGDLVINSQLTGSYGLIKNGAGTLTLAGNSSVSARLTVNEGKVVLAAGNDTWFVRPDGGFGGESADGFQLLVNGGTLDLSGHNQAFGEFRSSNPYAGGSVTNTGTNVATLTHSHNDTDTNKYFDFGGSLDGNLNYVKSGSAQVRLTSASTMTGSITVRGGLLILRDNAAFANLNTTDGVKVYGGAFELDNYGGLANIANRLPAGTNVTLQGGTFRLRGYGGETSTQALGTVTLLSGSNTVEAASGANSSSAAEITIANLVRDLGNRQITLNLVGTNVGTPGLTASRLLITQQNGVAMPSGFMGGSVVLSSGELGYYDATYGVIRYGSGLSGALAYDTAFGSGKVYYNGSTNVTLAAAGAETVVAAMRVGTNADRTISFTTGTQPLNLESGGFVRSNDNNLLTIGTTSSRGRITAGGGSVTVAPPTDPALYLHVNQSTTTVHSVIADNPYDTDPDTSGTQVGKLRLVKNLGGTVVLTAENTYTGDTIINGGTLRLARTDANGTTEFAIQSDNIIINNGYLNIDATVPAGQFKPTAVITVAGNGRMQLAGDASGTRTYTLGKLVVNSSAGSLTTYPGATIESAAGTTGIIKITGTGIADDPVIQTVNDQLDRVPSVGVYMAAGKLDFGDNTTTRIIEVSGTAPVGLTIGVPIVQGKLEKRGGSMMVLTAPAESTFTGGLTITGGSVRLDDATAAGSGPIAVAAGAALWVNAPTLANTVSLAGGTLGAYDESPVVLNGSVTTSGNATVWLSDPFTRFHAGRTVTIAGKLTVSSGTLTAAAADRGGQTFLLYLNNLTNEFTGTLATSGDAQIDTRSTTGSGSTLGGGADYTGTNRAAISLGGGSLLLRDDALGVANAELPYDNNVAVTADSTIDVNRVTSGNGVTFRLNNLALGDAMLTGASGYSYKIAFAGTTTVGGTGKASLAGSTAVLLNGPVTLNQKLTNSGTATTINGAVSSTTADLVNTGTLTLTNESNAVGGAIVAAGGTLTARAVDNAGSVLGSSLLTFAGGTLNVRDDGAGSNGTLAYGNNLAVTGGSSTLSLDRATANAGNTVQFGTLALGDGTLNISSGNSYKLAIAGTTTVGGTGQARLNTVGVATTLQGLTMSSPGTIGGNVTVNGAVTGNGALATTGTVMLAGGATHGGALKPQSGLLTVAAASSFHSLETAGDGALLLNAGAGSTVTFSATTGVNDGRLYVKSGITDLSATVLTTNRPATSLTPNALSERFFRASDVGLTTFRGTPTEPGDDFITFENALSFLTATPGATGTLGNKNLAFTGNSSLTAESGGYLPGDQYGAAWVGAITVGGTSPLAAGIYTFGTRSDDGSTLYIDLNQNGLFEAGERVVNNADDHSAPGSRRHGQSCRRLLRDGDRLLGGDVER